MCPPSRGVLLVSGHHEARAHRAPLQMSALANAKAALSGLREAALIVRKLKVGQHGLGVVVRTHPQIGVEWIRVYHFTRIHLPLRIPYGFEFTERLDQFGTKHLGQELGARLSIP